jgi:hypothetical protein
MSHYALWNMCVELDLPYIAIAEEDLYLKPINEREQTEIERILARPNSLYLGTIAHNEKTKPNLIKGAHFYIVSNAACEALVEEAFPIDVQTDYYLLHMGTNKRVNVEGFELGVQKNKGPSSIQNVCVKCILPDKTLIYVIVGIGLLVGIALVAILSHKLMKCRQSLRGT